MARSPPQLPDPFAEQRVRREARRARRTRTTWPSGRFEPPEKSKQRRLVLAAENSVDPAFPRPASGTAYSSSAGTLLHVGIMLHASGGPPPINTDGPIHVHLMAPYPALTGGRVYIREDLPFISLQRTDSLVGPCGFSFPVPGS